MGYKKNRRQILNGLRKLKAARTEENPTYPALPDAPPIPKGKDDTVAVGLKKRA